MNDLLCAMLQARKRAGNANKRAGVGGFDPTTTAA